MLGLAVTASVAVAWKVAAAPGAPVASAVMSAGTVSAGGVVSRTVTLNDLVPVLPALSVLLTVTLVAPRAKTEPLAWSGLVASLPSTASAAEVAKVTAAPLGPVASATMSAGTVMLGAVV